MFVGRLGLGFWCAISAIGCWNVAAATEPLTPSVSLEQCDQAADEEAEDQTDGEPGVVVVVSSAEDDFRFQLSNYLQEPVVPARPLLREQGTSLPAAAQALTQDVFVTEELRQRLVGQQRRVRYPWGTNEFVLGSESGFRVSSDAGNLLDKSLSAPATRTQPRSPNSSDPRVRGARTGRLVVSGSYWTPARDDLDTPLDKIDSRLLQDMVVIKGPYTSRLGPALRFIDFELVESPRYEEGFRAFAGTALEYKTNGQQWYGRQNIWGGGQDWGFRVGYGHRTGNDYETGSSLFDSQGLIPASYNSRNLHVAGGYDPTPTSRLEFYYLRMDETNVEYPSLIFDVNALMTDGYQVRYTDWGGAAYDLLEVEGWYNRTAFTGDTRREGKNRQIPTLRDLFALAPDQYLTTDVDGMSAGYRAAVTWGEADCLQWTIGTDLIRLGQQLNDIEPDTERVVPFPPFPSFTVPGMNHPIPRSQSLDIGLFTEQIWPYESGLTFRTGARVDLIQTNAREFVSGMGVYEGFPPENIPTGLSELKDAELEQNFFPWSLYATAEYPLTSGWSVMGGTGYGMRPPTLTELYAAGPFIGSLQPGLTYVEGDPELNPERMVQLDLGVRGDLGDTRVSLTGFYAWVFDYITYDDVGLYYQPPFAPFEPGQELQQAAYVNTDLATLTGFELLADHDLCSWLTGFAWMSYVQGEDRSRNAPSRMGALLREQADYDPDTPRSFVDGVEVEPLPGISPLEARVGLRIHEPLPNPSWGAEFEVRMVDRQDRIAATLFEQVTPGFTILNARAFWRPWDDFSIFGGAENITDKFYREHLDFRSGRGTFRPGVNFYLLTEVVY
jgi:outer membrane receptor protein involved in Fe transport